MGQCFEDGSRWTRAVAGPSEDVIPRKAVGASSDTGAGKTISTGLAYSADIEVIGRTARDAGVSAEDQRRNAGGAVGGCGRTGEARRVAG